jgi:hypothetical protein
MVFVIPDPETVTEPVRADEVLLAEVAVMISVALLLPLVGDTLSQEVPVEAVQFTLDDTETVWLELEG